MAEKKKLEERDDDFGGWLARRNGDIDEHGNKTYKHEKKPDVYRQEAKRIVTEQQKKKKTAKK